MVVVLVVVVAVAVTAVESASAVVVIPNRTEYTFYCEVYAAYCHLHHKAYNNNVRTVCIKAMDNTKILYMKVFNFDIWIFIQYILLKSRKRRLKGYIATAVRDSSRCAELSALGHVYCPVM